MVKAMSVAELPIHLDLEKIAAFCRARGIRKLSLFRRICARVIPPCLGNWSPA
jgi:hypothetical protein